MICTLQSNVTKNHGTERDTAFGFSGDISFYVPSAIRMRK